MASNIVGVVPIQVLAMNAPFRPDLRRLPLGQAIKIPQKVPGMVKPPAMALAGLFRAHGLCALRLTLPAPRLNSTINAPVLTHRGV